MKNYVCFVVLLYSFFSSAFGQYTGNLDDTAEIERPCPTYDLNCIRAFFQKHAHCKKTFGPVPDPLNRPENKVFLPRNNMSVSTSNLDVYNLNGRVEEFYINRKNDRLVISVEFRNMNQSTNSVFFIFHRRAKEPVVTVASGSISYASLIITAVIPNLDDLQLHDAECTSYADDPTTRLEITPNAGVSSDPQTAEAFANFLTNRDNHVAEFFLTDSGYFIASYIQYNICDFGLFLT